MNIELRVAILEGKVNLLTEALVEERRSTTGLFNKLIEKLVECNVITIVRPDTPELNFEIDETTGSIKPIN